MAVLSPTRGSAFRFALFLFLLAAISFALIYLPIEKTLKRILLWINNDLGAWGPFVLAALYIPLTILAVPASVLTFGLKAQLCRKADFRRFGQDAWPKLPSQKHAVQRKTGFELKDWIDSWIWTGVCSCPADF